MFTEVASVSFWCGLCPSIIFDGALQIKLIVVYLIIGKEDV